MEKRSRNTSLAILLLLLKNCNLTCDIFDSPKIHAQQENNDHKVGDETIAEEFTHDIGQDGGHPKTEMEKHSKRMPERKNKNTDYMTSFR